MNDAVLVEYIGLKAEKVDNVAGTGLVWRGSGDVQPVPFVAWAKLSAFPQVWREAGQSAVRTLASVKPAPTFAAVPTAAPASPASTAQPAIALAGAGILYGSSKQPSLIQIGDTEVQLGTVVAAAQSASGLSEGEWNALTEADREDFIEAQVESMRTADADAKVKAAAAGSADPVPLTHAELKAELRRLNVPFKGNPSRETLQALFDEATAAKG